MKYDKNVSLIQSDKRMIHSDKVSDNVKKFENISNNTNEDI